MRVAKASAARRNGYVVGRFRLRVACRYRGRSVGRASGGQTVGVREAAVVESGLVRRSSGADGRSYGGG